MVKHLSTMWETQIQSLGRGDSLEKEMATYSSTLAQKISWTEKPGAGYCPRGREEPDTTVKARKQVQDHVFKVMEQQSNWIKKNLIPKLMSLRTAIAAVAANSHQLCPTVRPHRWQPTRLLRPWDSPGKNSGVGCHFLYQCMKVKSESEVTQSCLTLRDPMDGSPPGSPAPGILQARTLEWVAIFFSNA